MENIFRFEDYPYPEKWMMACFSKEESDYFRNFMHEHGRKWCTNNPYTEHDEWEESRGHLLYSFNYGQWGAGIRSHEERGYNILYFSDFKWEDLADPFDNCDHKLIDEFLQSFSNAEVM